MTLFDLASSESAARDCRACKGTTLAVVCERTGIHPDCPFRDSRGAFNHCTLDGVPARIIGTASPYATIEPVDIDAEPMCCCWDVVAEVLENGGAFVRDDDDTDD
jgi:hypothetical protein